MEEVRRLRQERGWTQTELAFYSGLAPSVISQIETGKRDPSASTLRKLAKALGVEVRDLFPLEQPRLPDLKTGEAYFVPLEEGEEEDTVTFRIYHVRLLDRSEPILQAMREASPEEVRRLREQLEKAGRGSA
jgi:transcriptional regulator with XRE-family HTH domain